MTARQIPERSPATAARLLPVPKDPQPRLGAGQLVEVAEPLNLKPAATSPTVPHRRVL